MNLADLKKTFEPSDIEFRAGATNQDKTKALALPYLTARSIMDRLDSVCGPENWQDTYQAGPGGGVLCGISIKIGDAWITKFDGADNTDIEAVKGGLSDAFKRCAVKWGIGRDLYALPRVWVKAEQRGKSVVIDEDEARAKMFGGGQRQASQPAPRSNGSQAPTAPKANGQAPAPVRNFQTLKGLLAQLQKDFKLDEPTAKAKLREAGHNGFAVEKSGQMYADVKNLMGAAQ
jgi:hypothetical protein